MAARQPSRSTSASQLPQPSANNTSSSALHQAPRRTHHPYMHGSMARRHPAAPSSISAASNATTTVAAHQDSRPATATDDTESDIIVRDERGDFRLEMPTMTPLPRDEAKDEREMENRLIETYRKHHQQIEPAELKKTLQASLLAKAASLDEDAWIFEGDDVTPLHSP